MDNYLPFMPFADAEVLRDVIWYDGPLLTHKRTKEGQDVFDHWFDQHGEAGKQTYKDVWLMYTVSKEDLTSYFEKKIPVRNLWKNASEMWRVTLNYQGKPILIEKISANDIPESLWPTEDSFYNESLAQD